MPNPRELLERFAGIARLFPLPNLALFPGIEQGLHIFEPRYRQMMAEALDGDGLIAMVLLKPDWEPNYDGAPEIERTACLGRISAWERLPDGRYNLRLEGLARFRIEAEVRQPEQLFRSARGVLAFDIGPEELSDAIDYRRRLGDTLLAKFAGNPAAVSWLSNLISSDDDLGTVCDRLAYALPLPLLLKQQLLDNNLSLSRARMLLDTISTKDERGRFPPKFSYN